MPIISFNHYGFGHILVRFPKKKNKDDKYGDKYKCRKDDDNKSYKEKGKKSFYIAKKESDSESRKSNEIEVLYVAIKDDFDDDTTALISYMNKDDK